MVKDLCGTIFIKDGLKYDYCFEQSIRCLQEFCDHVVVINAGSEDDTYEVLKRLKDYKTTIISTTPEEWYSFKGKERLVYFTDMAIEVAQELGFKYQINLQGDEIIHPDSYQWIRAAISQGKDGYFSKRINLWHDPRWQLNVPQNRKPCSTEIVRLTKTFCRSYDDAENCAVSNPSDEFIDFITFIHYGFVRKREIMVDKIKNMQCGVFGMENFDQKLNGMEIFQPEKWFSKDDLIPFFDHPPLMHEWVTQRTYPD